MKTEQKWKTVFGHKNYECCKEGQIRNKKTKRLIKQFPILTGYYQVIFCENNKRTKEYVHRVIAYTWIRKPYKNEEINHLDHNKANNSVDNLVWTTHQNNARHTIGRHYSPSDLEEAIRLLKTGMPLNKVLANMPSLTHCLSDKSTYDSGNRVSIKRQRITDTELLVIAQMLKNKCSILSISRALGRSFYGAYYVIKTMQSLINREAKTTYERRLKLAYRRVIV